jgi:hypothetical protein
MQSGHGWGKRSRMTRDHSHLPTLFSLVLVAGCGSLGAYNPEFLDSGDLADIAAGDADTDADADADADVDADTDSDTDPCVPPDVWDLGAQGPAAGQFSPTYVGVSLWGIVETGSLYDYNIDGTDGSAFLVFDFFDGTGMLQCSAIFDASTTSSPSNTGWTTDSGGVVWEGYAFALNGNDGFTDCNSMDGSLGYTDVRNWAASRSWRVGIGAMTSGLRSSLQSAVDATFGAGTWASDWDPYVLAQFVDFSGPQALESSYTMVFPHECYEMTTTGTGTLQPDSAPNAGPIDGYLGSSGAWTIVTMAALP